MSSFIEFVKTQWHGLTIVSLLALVCGACAHTSGGTATPRAGIGHEDMSVRKRYVDSRFGQIHLRIFDTSAKDRRPALLMLHLSPNSGQIYSDFLPLIGADRVAVAPDYPGYGMSDPIEGTQRIEDYAVAMLDVLDALELDFPLDVLGYHTGAAVALEMARQNPDRIRKVVLVAVPVLTDDERQAGAALPQIPFDTDGNFAREEWQRSWRWRGPGQSVESVFATFGEKMRPGVRDRGARAVLAYDLQPALLALRHPLLVVRVKDDLWVPTHRARELRPDAAYLELSQYGHGLFHAAPEVMNRVVREFLDE